MTDEAMADCLGKNMVLTLQFSDKLDCHVFQTLDRMTPHKQYGEMFFFCSFSEYLAPICFHWVEFSPSMRLKGGYVDLKMSPEPQLTCG